MFLQNYTSSRRMGTEFLCLLTKSEYLKREYRLLTYLLGRISESGIRNQKTSRPEGRKSKTCLISVDPESSCSTGQQSEVPLPFPIAGRKFSVQPSLPHGRKPSAEDIHLTAMDKIQHINYYFENGLRKVVPYYYTWTSHAKGRWLGQTLEQVFNKEFFSVNDEAVRRMLAGTYLNLSVNGIRVDFQHKIREGDFIASYAHRHEMPVANTPIKIIAETDDLLVVDKPPSIPVHPCGRFRMNSAQFILAREHGFNNLRAVHRLDRLTSGLLVFAKTSAVAQVVHRQMLNRSVHKEYVCRVKGQFLSAGITCTEPIDCVNERTGLFQVRDTGRQCITEFNLLAYDDLTNTSIVHCKPLTGRTHQIRVHLQHLCFPIANDPIYGGTPYTGSPNSQCSIDPSDLEKVWADLKRYKYRVLDELPTSPWTRDPQCKECWVEFEDPLPESLRIDLHAWKYEGPGWRFETDLPEWAAAAAPTVTTLASANMLR